MIKYILAILRFAGFTVVFLSGFLIFIYLVLGAVYSDIITSKKQCFEYINNPANQCYFKYYKKLAIKHLNEFWDLYPDGLIYFG